jgi:hypothetical protein
MLIIRQNATHKVVIGPVVAVGDGFTPVTTLDEGTADEAEAILHNNGTVVDISGVGYPLVAITTADGYYHLTLATGITSTVGHLTVIYNDDSLCLPVRADFTVVEEAVYDKTYKAAATGVDADWTPLGRLDVLLDAIPTTAMRGTDSGALASVATEARLAELDAANLPTDVAAIPTTAMRGTDSALTDKAGFSLSTAGILAVWHQALTAVVTAGTVGKLLKDEITAARMAVLTDWIDAGRLDALLDAIPTTAMRGTDSAALASVATEARLAELDAANLPTDIAAIPTTAMRGTDSAALASVATEARLAELDAANIPADIAAIPTTAMRGTDSANTTTPPTVNAIVDQVWDEAQADHVAVGSFGVTASEIAAIPTTAMRGTDSAALASVATEARLAELDAANLPTDIAAIPTTAMRGTDSAALASVATEARLAELDAANLPTDIAAIPTTAMRGTDNVVLAGPTKAEMDTAHALLATPAQVNTQVVDVLRTDTAAELSAVPAASPALHTMIQLLYMALRNKVDVTANNKEVHVDAGTVLGTKTLSDDATTYSETKMA